MDIKIKDLERKLLISTKTVECMRMEKRTDPFKEENSRLKKSMEEMETKQSRLRYEIKKQREAPPPPCPVCLKKSTQLTKDSFTAPELTMSDLAQREFEQTKMIKKVDDLKYVCRERKRRNDEMEVELSDSLRKTAELDLKYKQVKYVCELRYNEIQKLKGDET